MNKINLLQKFSLFNETWTPKIIGELNGQYVKLAKIENEFVWHSHEDEDELFLVVKGTMYMHFREKIEVVEEGEIIIVPKGVEHNPKSLEGEEVWVLLFEPKDTKHTGEVEHELTKHQLDWI